MSPLFLFVVLGCLAGGFFTTKFLVIVSILTVDVVLCVAIPNWKQELAHILAIEAIFYGAVFLFVAWLTWFYMNGPSIFPSIQKFILR